LGLSSLWFIARPGSLPKGLPRNATNLTVRFSSELPFSRRP
jgi:hypothetical protein